MTPPTEEGSPHLQTTKGVECDLQHLLYPQQCASWPIIVRVNEVRANSSMTLSYPPIIVQVDDVVANSCGKLCM